MRHLLRSARSHLLDEHGNARTGLLTFASIRNLIPAWVRGDRRLMHGCIVLGYIGAWSDPCLTPRPLHHRVRT